MKPAPFRYARARSVAEAVQLIASVPDARALAGGQSLIPALNMRLASPPLVVDINGIPDLDRIEVHDGVLTIGALVRHAQAERSDLIAAHAPLLARALPHIAHPAIRNRGTLAGSLALADPAAELPACFLALAGVAVIEGPQGRRTVAADDFFKSLMITALGPHDILTAIHVPVAAPNTRVGFAEFSRRHGDYALAGLAACAQAQDGRLAHVRLAFFAVAATPVRARRAEAALADGPLDATRIDAAAVALADDLDPEGDIHASGAMKKHLAGVLLRRVASQLAEARA